MVRKKRDTSKMSHPIMTMLVVFAGILLALAVVYFTMPQFNPRTVGFWVLLAILLIITTLLVSAKYGSKMEKSEKAESVSKIYPVAITTLAVLAVIAVAVIIIGGLLGAKCFAAASYASVIGPVQHVDMEEYQISLDDVPLLDKDSAYLLANRKMGTLVDLVSQFALNQDVNIQINYQGKPVRVIPLKYNGPIKWLNNRENGIPGYVVVDMQTLSAELVYVDGGIHFAPSAYFNEDLMRHVYLQHPTDILDGYSFELMDDGTPIWLVRKWVPTTGMFSVRDLAGIYTVNATTGETTYYGVEDIPQWVDTAYPANTIIKQYDWHGELQGGWWNSIFGKRGVVKTTDGYNYIAYNDDIYLYTGITSVASDESNIGFIFTNLRTKETTQYMYPSAEEYSAMASAEGQVQHLGYNATFPIMVRVADVPTYCMALKDSAGLVKQYAMVNAEQYQVVVAAATVEQTVAAYIIALDENGIEHGETTVAPDVSVDMSETEIIEGKVSYITSAVIDGNTYYYIMVDLSGFQDEIFEVPAFLNKDVITTEVGDTVEIYCNAADIGMVRQIPVTKFNWFYHNIATEED